MELSQGINVLDQEEGMSSLYIILARVFYLGYVFVARQDFLPASATAFIKRCIMMIKARAETLPQSPLLAVCEGCK